MKVTTAKLVTSCELVQAKETLLLCAFILQLVITGNLQLTKLGQLLGCRFPQGSDCKTKLYRWILGPGGMLETVHGQPSCIGEVKTSIMCPDASAHSHSRQKFRFAYL
ncbi:hypothetical protein PVAP13_5KG698501 [Panicum virgatum]|uniref:Uncharacterized protein n=1 Tax=Panicum virgatum TaxID=38727 RepID=A0A8T0SUW6_PANVG|nr:hypothetical protein PVAP13_5KG698501 [Panicum virgatum]